MSRKEYMREYMKKYMLDRYKRRKLEATSLLGSICNMCGSEKDLEFDHIDKNTKKYTIANIWSYSEKKFWDEIKKCQLLCSSCHDLKTNEDLGKQNAKNMHGTISSYRYCKCELCKKAKSDYSRKMRLLKMGC